MPGALRTLLMVAAGAWLLVRLVDRWSEVRIRTRGAVRPAPGPGPLARRPVTAPPGPTARIEGRHAAELALRQLTAALDAIAHPV